MSKKTSHLRVAAYLRVSDPSQVEKYSLDAQRADIKRWCKRHGYELVRVYTEEGKSARTERIDRRPKLVALLGDATADQFDIVVVHMIDRWSRNVGVQRQALQMLGDAGVGFASVMEDFDFTTPSGKLMLTMIGGVAEFFSDQLGAHVSKAQRYRASIGMPVGPIPFGYDVIEPGGVPQMVGKEVAVVRQIFERRSNGESTGTIASWVNSQGFKTRKGGIFTSHTIKDMLGCRFYLGIVRYGEEEYPGQHEAIIAEDLYQRVQSRKRHGAIIRTVQGPKGVLQGIINCGNCGNKIQSDRHRFGGAMYRERHSHQCSTNNRSIMAKSLDEQIEVILTSVKFRPQWRDEMARLAIASTEGPSPKELNDKLRRVSKSYIAGGISDSQYEADISEINARLRLTENVELPTLEEAARLFGDIPQLWEEATPEERRKLISPIVEQVYVDMESSMIGAIVPAAGFRRLLEGAMARAEDSAVMLLSEDETDRQRVWSWWRRGRLQPRFPYIPNRIYFTPLKPDKAPMPSPGRWRWLNGHRSPSSQRRYLPARKLWLEHSPTAA